MPNSRSPCVQWRLVLKHLLSKKCSRGFRREGFRGPSKRAGRPGHPQTGQTSRMGHSCPSSSCALRSAQAHPPGNLSWFVFLFTHVHNLSHRVVNGGPRTVQRPVPGFTRSHPVMQPGPCSYRFRGHGRTQHRIPACASCPESPCPAE